MSTYSKNDISFNLNDDSWIQFPKMKNTNSNFYEGKIEKLIHSIEIDWDNIILPNVDSNTGGSKTINDTSELMALINIIQKEIYILTKAVIELSSKFINYYWYIGSELSTSISNIQIDNTKSGWHNIGSSLSEFSLNFSRTNAIEFDVPTQYYIIIPDNLHIYAADGNTIMEEQTFNYINNYSLSGYKAFQYKSAVWDVKGVIIK